jgi:hypothetical protein
MRTFPTTIAPSNGQLERPTAAAGYVLRAHNNPRARGALR